MWPCVVGGADGFYAPRICSTNESQSSGTEASHVTPPATLPPVPESKFIFVCYAHDDWKVVSENIAWLRANGFEVWFDEAIAAGSRWSEDLAQAVERCATVLYFLSPRSASSRYCLDEIHFALECGRPIVPAEIEPVTLTPGLRLSLGGTHRLFMYKMDPEAFREKLASGLRAAMEGSVAPGLHADPAPAAAQLTTKAPPGTASIDWRPIVVGAAAALVAFAAIYLT